MTIRISQQMTWFLPEGRKLILKLILLVLWNMPGPISSTGYQIRNKSCDPCGLQGLLEKWKENQRML